MTEELADRILVVGAGRDAELVHATLGRDHAPIDRASDLRALPDGRLAETALVVEAGPDAEKEAKAAAVRALVDLLPGRVPIAVATRIHRVDALLPSSRHGTRVVGLHLVGAREGDRPAVAEVAMPGEFDDAVVDGVLTLLEARGLVALPCGDAPGRIVDRLVAVAWLESRSALAAGASAGVVTGALADAGTHLAALGQDDVAGPIVTALHANLGAPDRFDPAIVRSRSAVSLDRGALTERLVLAVIAEAYRLVEEAVAGAEEIERAMSVGAGWAVGPFTMAGRRGLRAVVTGLAALARDPSEDPAARDRFAMPRVLWTMATV